MSRSIWNCGIPVGHFWPLAASLALIVSTPSCNKSQIATQTAQTQAAQKTFASPDDAGAALLAAAQSGNQDALIAIFGPNSKGVLLTGDSQTDSTRLKNFVDSYNQMHRSTSIKAGGEVLQVGADNSSFPIPLGQNSAGRWYFDTAAGKDEILARHIGKNELTAMDASRAIANAQQQYHQAAHDGGKTKEYAQKFVSDPGKHNGLYWPATQGQPPSPLGQLSDFTAVLSSAGSEGKPLPFEG
jgi:Protein of unknown function (DUF2950)